MSIDTVNDLPARVQYEAAAAQTVFPYPFPIFQDADLVVEVDDAVQTLTTHYSVSGAGDDTGGNVTFVTGRTAGQIITIYRSTAIERTSDFQQNGPFFAASVNDDLDRLTVIAQELREQIQRSLRIPFSAEVANEDIELTPTSSWRNKYLAFDADGKPVPAELVTGTITQQIIGALLNPRTAAEIAAGVTPTDYSKVPGNIRRYGAVVNGVTDDAAAFRRALDVAARDHTTVTCDPPGEIKLGSTIYIPQTGGFNSENGVQISLYGCRLIGQGNGVGTMFETGKGNVSTGGSTNFGEPIESATSLHLGLVIKGARFRSFGTALRFYNFVQGCSLRDCWFEDGDKALYAFRCFYMTMFNCSGRLSGLSASDAVFHFDTEVNVITIVGCSAHGVGGSGWLFAGGVKGLKIVDTAAEGSLVGMKFTGQILGASIDGCYIEGNTTGIDIGSQSKSGLDIDSCYFTLNTTDLTGDNWQSGQFGPANVVEDGAVIALGGNGNFCEVHLPTAAHPDTGTGNHTTWAVLPSGWTLNESIKVIHNAFIYLSASGGQALLARMEPVHSGNKVIPMKYAGSPGVLVTNIIPFCTTSLQNSNNDLRIDTKLDYGAGGAVMFDVQLNDSIAQYNVGGRIVFSNVVYRDDSSGKTVTIANNGGLIRITLSGFNNIVSYVGTVRAI